MKGPSPIPLAERFWGRVNKTETCWLWTGGTTTNGYGRIYLIRGGSWKAVSAHRLSYELAFGRIPDGLCVLHHCDNPPCVNPAHLYAGTMTDNNRDMNSRGRHYRHTTHCRRGHEWTPDSTYSWRGRRECRECRDIRMREWKICHRGRQLEHQRRSRRRAQCHSRNAGLRSKVETEVK